VPANKGERDRVEQEFLEWREQEMKVRLQKTLDKIEKRSAEKTGS